MKRWLLLGCAFVCWPAWTPAQSSAPAPEFLALSMPERNLAVYDAFWRTLQEHHYDPSRFATADLQALRIHWRWRAASEMSSRMLYGSVLDAVTAQLPDSHVSLEPPVTQASAPAPSRYPAERVQRLNTLLAYGPGYFGTDVRRAQGTYGLVTEVLPDSPAATAGIQPGWRIVRAVSSLAIDDDVVRFTGEFIPLDDASALAWERGDLQPSDSDRWRVVKVNFDHRTLRARPRVESRRFGDVSYLRFDEFGDDAFMEPVLRAVDEAGAAGLVIDLRWNGGGLTHQLQRLAGALLADGVLLGRLQNSKGSEPLRSVKVARVYDGPLVLLVGPSSGSCSEILAAAVQDYKRGRVVGRMTNGSTLVSQSFPLPDGGSARVPITDFRTSRDRRIEAMGVVPDVRVMPTLADVRVGRDPTVERALALLQPAPAP
jgi:carboxyl-terminal processing protease